MTPPEAEHNRKRRSDACIVGAQPRHHALDMLVDVRMHESASRRQSDGVGDALTPTSSAGNPRSRVAEPWTLPNMGPKRHPVQDRLVWSPTWLKPVMPHPEKVEVALPSFRPQHHVTIWLPVGSLKTMNAYLAASRNR